MVTSQKKYWPDCIHSTISKQQKLEDVEQQRKRGVPFTQEISNIPNKITVIYHHFNGHLWFYFFGGCECKLQQWNIAQGCTVGGSALLGWTPVLSIPKTPLGYNDYRRLYHPIRWNIHGYYQNLLGESLSTKQ